MAIEMLKMEVLNLRWSKNENGERVLEKEQRIIVVNPDTQEVLGESTEWSEVEG